MSRNLKVIFNDIKKKHTNKIEKFLKKINEVNYEITNFDPYEQKIDKNRLDAIAVSVGLC